MNFNFSFSRFEKLKQNGDKKIKITNNLFIFKNNDTFIFIFKLCLIFYKNFKNIIMDSKYKNYKCKRK